MGALMLQISQANRIDGSKLSSLWNSLYAEFQISFLKESLVTSFVLSALTIAVFYSQWVDLFEEVESPILAIDVFLSFALLFVLLSFVLCLVFKGLSKVDLSSSNQLDTNSEQSEKFFASFLSTYFFCWNIKSIFITTALIYMLWFPYIYASYPANMDWDTLNQIFQFATDAPVDYGARAVDVLIEAKYIDHDTVPTTLLFGSFWNLGRMLGNQNLGLFIYAALQSLFCALVFGILCSYLNRMGMSKKFCVFIFLFCALFPVFPNYASSMLKDSIFSPLFLLYFMLYIEAFRSKGTAFRSKAFVAGFVVLIICCVATKKAALYIILISSIVLIFSFRRSWLLISLSTIGSIICYSALMQFVVYPALDVATVGRQEMLSVPFQQTAVVAIRYPDECTEWEREVIEKVLPYDGLEDFFNPVLADPVKNQFNVNASLSDLLDYLVVYVAQGIRHPILYAETVLKLDGAMLVPSNSAGLMLVTCEEAISAMERFEGAADVNFSRSKDREDASSYSNHILWWAQSELGAVGSMGLYGGWLPIAVLIVSLLKSRRTFWVLVPITLSVLVLLICPTSTARYVLPLMYCAPLLISLLVLMLKRGDCIYEGET